MDKAARTPPRRRSGGRRKTADPQVAEKVRRTAPSAGRLNPLSSHDLERVHGAALDILAQIGMSEAPAVVVQALTARGGVLTEDKRLLFPKALVNEALAGLRRGFVLFGRAPGQDLDMSGAHVHAGSGGASPNIVDMLDGSYRMSTLADLYDAARLVDTLEHVGFFARSMIAGDMQTTRDLDVNTAFASLAGTSKHVMVSASHAEHVADIAQICYALAGSQEAFRARPFLSLNINHAVPPLRFDAEACEVIAAAVAAGIPVMVNTFGQMGASSPVTIAGCLAQTHAETLAGMVFAWVLDPDVRAIYGARPMVTDLRSGGMAGGSGEQAILTAAATQIARHCDLANSTIAGATDSKLADAQAGYEKALSVALAAQAGANLITQAAGTQAGLMATSFEAYVIDNDMIGAILQSATPIEVSDATLSTDVIAQTVRGEGHFLGHADTYARMKSDFVYPAHADRQPPDAWLASGAPNINTSARNTVRDTLARHFPRHISAEVEQELRARFDIRLPASRMTPA
ncbi:MAG: trimethylamine methyltransferase family protein [Aestuariivita sp.]|uniref:trimethylamine methyltransferase family protein n=1 Tax=Aestuariivita sp. TaxID=1872407 RepID=UPI003BB121B6